MFGVATNLVEQLGVLAVELLHGGSSVEAAVGDIHEGGGGIRGAKEAIDNGINTWVSKGEGFAGRGEDDDGDLGTTEDAEFTGLLEEACSAL